MKIALIRGAFMNQYESQIYYPLLKKNEIVGFSSQQPIQEKFPFKLVKLPSPMDANFGLFSRLKMPILNRMFVDAHWLIGLEDQIRGFDIAHCADTFYHFSHQAIVAKRKGYVKRVVATVFENIPFNNEGILGRKKFKSDVLKETDHFVAIAERSKAALMVEGCPEDKITVITQHIDTKRFKPTRKNYHKKKLTILYTGRIEFYKGLYEIIYAAKRLLEDHSLSSYDLEFLLVGDGTEKEKLKLLVNRLNITNSVKFLFLPYHKMEDVYDKADIFVAPSRATRTYQEQFCTALLEAQSAGLPIVTTYSGGIPENVGKNAIMANPGDFYSIAAGIKRFVVSPKLREHYGEMARENVVKNFDISIGAKKLEKMYEEVLRN